MCRRCAPRTTRQVLEITTAALAAQEAAKLQALVDHLESDNGAAPTDPAVMAYTLLVCNCAAEVAFVVMHILYSFVRASSHGCGVVVRPAWLTDAPACCLCCAVCAGR